MSQQLCDCLVLFIVFWLLIRNTMVLDVMSEFSIREQKQIIVVLSSEK